MFCDYPIQIINVSLIDCGVYSVHTMLLVKALYGCIQSARRFYELLAKVLCSMGFSSNPYDQCVFNKTTEDGLQCTIVVYVDNLKISCANGAVVESIIDELQQHFTKLTLKRGKTLEYLVYRKYTAVYKANVDNLNGIITKQTRM